MFQRNFRKGDLKESFERTSGKFRGNFRIFSMEDQESTEGTSRKFLKNIRKVLNDLQESFKRASGMF